MQRKERKYLFPHEFDKLYKLVSTHSLFTSTRQRDKVILLLMYRHGLRLTELVKLTWNNINLPEQRIYIQRLKNGKDSTHPLQQDEVIQLAKLRSQTQNKKQIISTSVFINARTGSPIGRDAVINLFKKINSLGVLDVYITPHTLRHSCGYYLANKGYDTRLIQDYLGHRNIQNTEIYTELSAKRFDSIKW